MTFYRIFLLQYEVKGQSGEVAFTHLLPGRLRRHGVPTGLEERDQGCKRQLEQGLAPIQLLLLLLHQEGEEI